MIEFFKNLFTLSDALFIFIGDKDLYEKCSIEKNRPKEYTYFPSKYFISRPLWSDLSNYLGDIVASNSLTQESYETLKRSLCFDANNDFFDLKTFIKGRITNFSDNGSPIIELSSSNYNDVQKARFHKAVTVLFEQKYMTSSYSKWQENETLQKALFEEAKNLYNGCSGKAVEEVASVDVINTAKKDLYGFLYRRDALKLEAESQQNTSLGIPIKLRRYSYNGEIPNDIPDSLDALTEFEKRFIDKFETYCNYLLALINPYNKTIEQPENSFDDIFQSPETFKKNLIEKYSLNPNPVIQLYEAYDKLKRSKLPTPYNRNIIEQYIKDIDSHKQNFKNSMPSNITYMLVNRFLVKSALKNQSLSRDPHLFANEAMSIRNAFSNINPIVVFTSDYSRQLLLVLNNIELISTVKQQLLKLPSTHKIVSFVEERSGSLPKSVIGIRTDSPESLNDSLTQFLKKIEPFFNITSATEKS